MTPSPSTCYISWVLLVPWKQHKEKLYTRVVPLNRRLLISNKLMNTFKKKLLTFNSTPCANTHETNIQTATVNVIIMPHTSHLLKYTSWCALHLCWRLSGIALVHIWFIFCMIWAQVTQHQQTYMILLVLSYFFSKEFVRLCKVDSLFRACMCGNIDDLKQFMVIPWTM